MKMLRQWGGIVDICPDASPISKCDIEVYFLIVAGAQVVLKLHLEVQMFSHTIANRPHQINSAFNLDGCKWN